MLADRHARCARFKHDHLHGSFADVEFDYACQPPKGLRAGGRNGEMHLHHRKEVNRAEPKGLPSEDLVDELQSVMMHANSRQIRTERDGKPRVVRRRKRSVGGGRVQGQSHDANEDADRGERKWCQTRNVKAWCELSECIKSWPARWLPAHNTSTNTPSNNPPTTTPIITNGLQLSSYRCRNPRHGDVLPSSRKQHDPLG
jgi:hypothetical protein